jgi:hypothetical protein
MVTVTSVSALLVAACCLLLVLLAVVRRARFVAKLQGVPGPRALPVVGNALDFTGTQEDFFLYMKKCSDKYGPMFRLWVGTRPFICVHSAEGIQVGEPARPAASELTHYPLSVCVCSLAAHPQLQRPH